MNRPAGPGVREPAFGHGRDIPLMEPAAGGQ